MKEAAGEANLTVITIILIGVIVAVAIPLVTRLMGNTRNQACCTDAGGRWDGTTCVGTGGANDPFNQGSYQACIAE